MHTHTPKEDMQKHTTLFFCALHSHLSGTANSHICVHPNRHTCSLLFQTNWKLCLLSPYCAAQYTLFTPSSSSYVRAVVHRLQTYFSSLWLEDVCMLKRVRTHTHAGLYAFEDIPLTFSKIWRWRNEDLWLLKNLKNGCLGEVKTRKVLHKSWNYAYCVNQTKFCHQRVYA